MIEIKHVTKNYGSECALRDVSMTIQEGMNFIVGPSGSGKTTLLKIISGMDQEYDGEVCYDGINLKELTSKEKSSFYNAIYGFVWQDFNLLENATVLDNILLPTYLNDPKQCQDGLAVLRELKIAFLAYKKVKYLSGGQKQRVAIARELMKSPSIIIADEPTSALDAKTVKHIMEILHTISKKRTVIIVTHDTSLIQDAQPVYQLDNGNVIKQTIYDVETLVVANKPKIRKLSIRNTFQLAKQNILDTCGRSFMSVVTIFVASMLLLTSFGGSIEKGSNAQFDNLLKTYGKSILNIQVVNSFTSAAGTSDEGNDGPKSDVTQDISNVYAKYKNDKRVESIFFNQAFDGIKITVDGKEHQIDSSGSAPELKELLSGRMAKDKNEVVVPMGFVKKIGSDKDKIIGKEITFEATIYKWKGEQPEPKKVQTKAKVVGVADTTMVSEYEGKKWEYALDDAFFFSKDALSDMRKQADISDKNMNITIRANSMNNLLEIKNELNKQGIVPIGQFELIEDFHSLDQKGSELSGFASIIVGVFAILMVIASFLISSYMRKREYAIYKVSGYHHTQLRGIMLIEISLYAIFCIAITTIASSLIQTIIANLFGVTGIEHMLLKGIGCILCTSIIACLTNAIILKNTRIEIALKNGART